MTATRELEGTRLGKRGVPSWTSAGGVCLGDRLLHQLCRPARLSPFVAGDAFQPAFFFPSRVNMTARLKDTRSRARCILGDRHTSPKAVAGRSRAFTIP